MSTIKFSRTIAVAIIAALALGLLGTRLNVRAQSISCSSSNLVDVTLSTGGRWQMCWETRSSEGIVLHDITYTAPGQPARMVLAQANLAQLHVPYDDNGARFHDLTDYGLGGSNLDDLTAAECPNGTLIRDGGKNVLCQQVQPAGYAYKYYGNQRQGQLLSLFSVSHIGQYNYIPELKFFDNGIIEFGVGATGRLQRLSGNPAYGWPLNPGNTTHGISHVHNYYWRLDFDLNATPNNDQVEEIEFTPNGARELFTLGQSPFTSEVARGVSPLTYRSWRVKDTSAINADGHAISYHLEAEAGHIFHGPSYEPFTQNELYVTVNKTCEKFASHNPTGGGCGRDLSAFVNGESLSGADIVVWYGLSFHHLPRDEDQNLMSAHWSSFQIVPRDWSATNPMDGDITPPPATATFTPTVPITPLTPTNTPTATNTPAPGLERIVNGGFESGLTPWILNGNTSLSSGSFPHSGASYLSIGNVNSPKGFAYQTIAVPVGTAPSLTFWLNVTSNETTTTATNDILYIEIRSASGNLLQTLTTYSNLDEGSPGVYVQRGGFDLSAYAGQTIRVQFRITGNASQTTTFLVDDVSVR